MYQLSWSKEAVRLACEACGAHRTLDPRRFAKAAGGTLRCTVCGAASQLRVPPATPPPPRHELERARPA